MGFSFDKSGKLSVDSAKFSNELSANYDKIKKVFVGDKVSMTKGFGTQVSEYLDNLDSYDGVLSLYDNGLNHRKESMEKEKAQAIKSLDSKYKDLTTKYAAYTDIISKMETSFKGFQNMIRG